MSADYLSRGPVDPITWLAEFEATSGAPADVIEAARFIAAHANPDGTLPPKICELLEVDAGALTRPSRRDRRRRRPR